MRIRPCSVQCPRPAPSVPLASGISAEAVALRNILCETPFSRHWQPTDPAIAILSPLYANADDVLPMVGAAGMAIVRRAWEKAHAGGGVDEDYDAFAGRFALWLLERLSTLHSGLECPDIAPFLVEMLQIRSYLEMPDRVGTTRMAEAWIRQAETLGLCRVRVRVGVRAELDILVQQDDCLLFPVLGMTMATASLEARCATVQDLAQRIVLPGMTGGSVPFPDASPDDALSYGAMRDQRPQRRADQPSGEVKASSPQGSTSDDESDTDEMVHPRSPVSWGSPSSVIPASSSTLSAMEAPRPGMSDIPFAEPSVVSPYIDEAVRSVVPYAHSWFGTRTPTLEEREIVRGRMRSVLQGTRAAFQALYARLVRRSPYTCLEEFFVALCVHCEAARHSPSRPSTSASGPTPFQPGIVYYRATLPGLPPLTVVVRPSRRHPLARVALLLNPNAGEMARAAQLLY